MTPNKNTTTPRGKRIGNPEDVAAKGELTPAAANQSALIAELRELILSARQSVAQTVNSTLTMLYWQIGRRIRQDVLQSKRAGYGEQIVATLGRQLERDFGRGFGEKNLHRMIQFATVFPDETIVAALRRQLGWTHFKALISLNDPLKRDFYAEMCRIEQWSRRTLEKKISGMLFERTALSKKPDKLMDLDKRVIHLASYLNKMLPRKQLEKKLHASIDQEKLT